MAKHTPGPWIFYADTPSTDPDWHIVTNANRQRIVANVHIETGDKTELANAELIAAAPDMFTALHDVNTWAHSLPTLEGKPEDGSYRDALKYFVEEIWPIVDAALAKADREYVA